MSFLGVQSLKSKSGTVPVADLSGKFILVYFSAHWCPPCRAFTPQLAKFYTDNHAAKNFEVVFASCDQDVSGFEKYYATQPWLAFDFEKDRAAIEALSAAQGIRGIPALIVFDADGKVITKDGRSFVSSDPSAQSFPWGA